ncbi:hypothetical protein MICAER10613_036990 [Microcystis aeruginosa]
MTTTKDTARLEITKETKQKFDEITRQLGKNQSDRIEALIEAYESLKKENETLKNQLEASENRIRTGELSYTLLGLNGTEILEVQNAEKVSLQSLQSIARDGLLQKSRYINSCLGKKDYDSMTDNELRNSTSKGSANARINNMIEKIKQYNDNQPDNSTRFFLTPSLIFKLTNSNFKIINNYFETYRNMIDDINNKYQLSDKDNRKGKGYDFKKVLGIE